MLTAPPGIIVDVHCPRLAGIPRSPSTGPVIHQRRAAIYRWRRRHANCLRCRHHCPNHRPTPPILRLIAVSLLLPPLGIAVPVAIAVTYTVAVPMLVAGDNPPYDDDDNKDDGVLSMVTHRHCRPIRSPLSPPLPPPLCRTLHQTRRCAAADDATLAATAALPPPPPPPPPCLALPNQLGARAMLLRGVGECLQG